MVDDIMDIKVERMFFSTGNDVLDVNSFDQAAVTVKVEQGVILNEEVGAISTGETGNFIDCSEALTMEIKEEKVDPLAVDLPVEEISFFTENWGTNAIHKVEDLGVDEEEGETAQVAFDSCISSMKREDSSHNGEEFDAITNEEASHTSVPFSVKSFPCPNCAAKFKTKNDLDRHSISHLRRFSCKYCAATLSTKIALMKHLEMHPNMRLKRPNISPCKILPCGKMPLRIHSLGTQDCLGNNLLSPRKILPHGKLPLRIYSSETKDIVINNSVTHPIQKRFLCQQCPSTFATKTTLKQHSVVHTGAQFFHCPHCGAFFKTQICLQKHLMTHFSTIPTGLKQSLVTISPRTILPRPTIPHDDKRFVGDCNNVASSEPPLCRDTAGFFSELHFTKPKAKNLKLKVVSVSKAGGKCIKSKKPSK